MLMLINGDHEVLLEQRPPAGIWGGLWGFPEPGDDVPLEDWAIQQLGIGIDLLECWPVMRHSFSHFHLDITPILAMESRADCRIMDTAGRHWYRPGSDDELGIAAPVEKMLKRLSTLENNRSTDEQNRAVRKTG